MDYGGEDHQTAVLGCVWLFGCKVKVQYARGLAYTAYRLHAHSIFSVLVIPTCCRI